MRAIQIRNTGGPEVLDLLDIAAPSMSEDDALIDISLAGINYIDIYHREGRYPKPLPCIPGAEGIGTIRKLGSNSPQDLKIGMRVGWVMHTGGYAEVAAIPAASLIPIPSDIADDAAVTLLLQGMTAHYLAKDSYKISRNDTVVVHSAAGGVGLLLTRYAASLGAKDL